VTPDKSPSLPFGVNGYRIWQALQVTD